MNINFNPNGNTRMTLRTPTSVNSKVMGFGRPAVIPVRDEPFTGVFLGASDSSFISNKTADASNATINDVPGPYYHYDGAVTELDSFIYIGFNEPFNAVKLTVGTAVTGTGNNLQWSTYQQISPFRTEVSNLQETVIGLKNMRTTTEGIVYWDMPTNWEKSYLRSSGELGEPFAYWIEIIDAGDTESFSNFPIITRILKTTPP
jgi:hypothetical protein